MLFIIFGRNTRKLGEKYNARTFPQLLGLHYNSRAIQIFIAAIIFIGMPLYAAVVMKGGAVFIEQMFHIDLHPALLIFTLIVAAYVITGGIKGVLYTDALQAVIMFAQHAVLAITVLSGDGYGLYRSQPETDGNRPACS